MSETIPSPPPSPPPGPLIQAPRAKRTLNKRPLMILMGSLLVLLTVFMLAVQNRLAVQARKTASADERGKVIAADDDVKELISGRPDGVIALGPKRFDRPFDAASSPRYQNDARPTPILSADGTHPLQPDMMDGPSMSTAAPNPIADARLAARVKLVEYSGTHKLSRLQLRDRMREEAFAAVTPLALPSLDTRLKGQPEHATDKADGDAETSFIKAANTPASAKTKGDNGPGTSVTSLNRTPAPTSPFVIQQGTLIPGILITGINSDLPGRIIAQVTRDVFDSRTGRHVLIPQGARLLGRYDNKIILNQSRVLVTWDRLIWPDGSSMGLGQMAGVDQTGASGLHDETDQHLGRKLTDAVLVSVLGAGVAAVKSSDDDSEIARALRDSFGDTAGRAFEDVGTTSLRLPPTLKIRPGYVFNIIVDKDLVLPPLDGLTARDAP